MAEYRTIETIAQDSFIERRSRFIGHAKPVQTEEEALAFIREIKAKHWDATHNVYAYVLREGRTARYSDDGEPQGTAGVPVLEVLQKPGITDAVLVVTRYFGGTLLGAGGLIRAYSHAASLAVQAAHIITMRECVLAHLLCDYSQYGRLQALVPECGGVLDHTEFTDFVRVSFHMEEPAFEALQPKLADATAGSVQAEIDGKNFFKFL